MNLIKPSYQILTDIHPFQVIRNIEAAGRTCYKSEDKITNNSASDFVTKIIKSGHESVIEHESISVRFICDRGCCYDDKTEVLTRDGWKKFETLNLSDEIACLSDNNELEWHLPKAIQSYDYDGKLLRFSNTSIDLLVTPNHKMWVFDHEKRSGKNKIWKFIDAQNLKNGRYVFSKKVSAWKGIKQNVVIPPHPTKRLQFPGLAFGHEKTGDLFELLGLWITDGSYRHGKQNGSGSCLQISQTKVDVQERIQELCSNLEISVRKVRNEFRIDNLRLVRFVEDLFGIGPKTFSAKIPNLIKESTSLQIKRFLRGVMLGDGNVHKENGHQVVYTSSYAFAGDLQELFLKIGLSANIRTIQPRERGEILGVKVNRCKVSYVVSVHGTKRSYPMLVRKCAKNFATPEVYNGKVWCATVPYHRLYVRRNGKVVWCGNSHELVRHRLASFSQESTRYVAYEEDVTFIIPPWIDDLEERKYSYCEINDIGNLWVSAMSYAEYCYVNLLHQGWSPQQARSVLPNSLKTEIVMTANLRELRWILKLRTSSAAHPQMKEIMVPLLMELQDILPEIFQDITIK